VTARVADPGQAVVLGAERDAERPRSGLGDERRRQLADAARHLEARRVERLGEPARRPFLLEAQLGMRVDAMAQRDQLVARGLEAFPRARLRVHRSRLPAEEEVVGARLAAAVGAADEDVGRDAPGGTRSVSVTCGASATAL